MKFVELKKHVREGTHYACYMLQGEDRFLISSAQGMFTALAEPCDFNVSTFDDQVSMQTVVTTLNTLPAMAQYRVVVVENLKTLPDEIVRYLKDPNPSAILLVVLKEGAKILKAYPNSVVVDCSHLSNDILESYIRRGVNNQINKDAAMLLIEYCMGDLSRISTEIVKLASFGAGRSITVQDVQLLVNKDTDYKIYQFLDKLASKQRDESLKILACMGNDAPPLKMIISMAMHFKKLLAIKLSPSADPESVLGIKPFQLKFMRRQAALFTAVQLKNIVDYIYDAEFRVKIGQIKDRDAMYNIILSI